MSGHQLENRCQRRSEKSQRAHFSFSLDLFLSRAGEFFFCFISSRCLGKKAKLRRTRPRLHMIETAAGTRQTERNGRQPRDERERNAIESAELSHSCCRLHQEKSLRLYGRNTTDVWLLLRESINEK